MHYEIRTGIVFNNKDDLSMGLHAVNDGVDFSSASRVGHSEGAFSLVPRPSFPTSSFATPL